MNFPWSSPKNNIIQSRKERDKTMIKADNKAIDFVMRIINDILEREIARDIKKYGNLMVFDTTDMRMELWYCFLEQYQVKQTPKSGLLVLEII